ncbi:MAG: phage major capsid protein [Candidatus Peribacteria bacterium]|nr:phage major capsid protein [Candidatus Peribacteria bacterium]
MQSANSAKVTITAQKLYTNIVVSDELSTFSIIELEALFIARLRRSITKSIANAILNSDDTKAGNVNCKETDDASTRPDYHTSTNFTYGKGLRAIALAGDEGVTKLNVGTITDIDFIFDLQDMITSAEEVSDISLIMDRKAYNAIRKTEDYKNAAKNGDKSTIITGAVDVIGGSSVFVTNLLKPSSADGKISNTASNNTQGTVIAVDARVIQNGSYGQVETNEERDFAVSDAIEAKVFWGMNNINSKFADKNFVAIGYNCQ